MIFVFFNMNTDNVTFFGAHNILFEKYDAYFHHIYFFRRFCFGVHDNLQQNWSADLK